MYNSCLSQLLGSILTNSSIKIFILIEYAIVTLRFFLKLDV